jgi:hypothetical protein
MVTIRLARRAVQYLAVAATLSPSVPAWAAATREIVANPITNPALTENVNDGVLQPVQFYLAPNSQTSGQASAYWPVPAGKRLVIEYYSAQAQDLTGGAVLMTLTTSVGGSSVPFIVFVNATAGNQVNQTTRIYADPGTQVQAFEANGGGATHCGGLISISGYLVNLPAR